MRIRFSCPNRGDGKKASTALSNWATIHSTKRRVRLPLAVSLADERFTCPVYDTTLSVNGCGNRHYLARAATNVHVRETLDRCTDCVVGAANLAGEPLPDLSLISKHKEAPMQSSTEAAQSGKTWKDRTCARDKITVFTPTAVQQKACGTCDKCIEADSGKPRSKGKPAAKPAASSNGSGKPKPAPAPAIAARVLSAPPNPVGDRFSGIASILELAGFRDVRLVDTPAGMMLVGMVGAGSA